jgi:hypothetical protein
MSVYNRNIGEFENRVEARLLEIALVNDPVFKKILYSSAIDFLGKIAFPHEAVNKLRFKTAVESLALWPFSTVVCIPQLIAFLKRTVSKIQN